MSATAVPVEAISYIESPKPAPVAIFKPKDAVAIKMAWPMIYPTTKMEPFLFNMRIQLVKDEEELQRQFLLAEDTDGELLYQHDVAMIASLSEADPKGFPGFPEGTKADRKSRIQGYFMPENEEDCKGFAFICRWVMATYWKAIEPAVYL